MPLGKILILGTGGTIAGIAPTTGNAAIYAAAQLSIDEVVQATDIELSRNIVTEQLCQIDSKDMDLSTMQAIVSRCVVHAQDESVTGIVITHGTDTLEETAFVLASLLKPTKPIVITGAMRPSNVPDADGIFNLRDALAVARDATANGVWVVFAGKIHHASVVRKVDPYGLDAFNSGWSAPAGRVTSGQVDWQSDIEPHCGKPYLYVPEDDLDNAHQYALSTETFYGLMDELRTANILDALLAYPRDGAWPWVEILSSGLGMTAAGVKAMVQAGVQGLVMAGTGNGTMQSSIHEALVYAQSTGVSVLVTTRCTRGIMVAAHDAPPLTIAFGMSAQQARMFLILRLIAAQHLSTSTQ